MKDNNKLYHRSKIFQDLNKAKKIKDQQPLFIGQIRNSMQKTKKYFSNQSGMGKRMKTETQRQTSKKLDINHIYKQKYSNNTKRNTAINCTSHSDLEISQFKNKTKEGLTKLSFLQQKNTPKHVDSQFRILQRRIYTNRSKNQKKDTVELDERKFQIQKSPKSIRRILKYSALQNDSDKSKTILRESVHKRKELTTELEGPKINVGKRQYSQQIGQKKDLPKILNRFNLSQKQLQMFGDRFPEKFQKIKLLGRGGFSLVWLGAHRKTRQLFAVKQILTKNTHQTHLKQIWFGNFFFQLGGISREQFINHSGINNLVKMISYDIQHLDTWIFYELCDQTLGSSLYELRAHTNKQNNEKYYKMTYQPLYYEYKNNLKSLKTLIIEISKSLCLLADHNIVHSDLKTQNILIKRTEQDQYEYKVTDYGSSFLFSNLKQFSMATPQYMAPQILNFILFQNQLPYDSEMLQIIRSYKNQSAIDIWSLGSIVLEIINGIPLWMSIKTQIDNSKQQDWQKMNQSNQEVGLFAVKGRLFDKIIEKQIQTVNNLEVILKNQNYSGIVVDEQLKYLLKKMLQLDPEQRIKPKEILNYLKVQINSEKNYFGV